MGRFISEDPISFAGGDSNLYRYVENNPVDSIDPSGNARLSLIDPPPVLSLPPENYPVNLVNSYPLGLKSCDCPNNGNNLVRAGQGNAKYFGASFLNDSILREQYIRQASKLAREDSEGRSQLKKRTRSVTSPIDQVISETMRPIKNEGSRSGGTANKTNVRINQLYGKPARILGGAGLAIGIGASLYSIGTAPENQRNCVIAQETGSLVGALSFGAAGTYIGGGIGSLFGGFGAIPGAFIGGVIGSGLGSLLGAQAGRNIYQVF